MEVLSFLPQPLVFDSKSCINIEKQRKILEYYAKPENERPKKNKTQLFSKQNIIGLASVLDINVNKLQFIQQEALSTEFNLFMQNARRINCNIGESLHVFEGTIIVLLDGCLTKKLQNAFNLNCILQSNLNVISQSSNSSYRRNQSIIMANQNRRSLTKTIEADGKLTPKLIGYDFLEPKPFECKTKISCIQFPDLTLQKLQSWIQAKQKQCLANFMSKNFPQIDDRKAQFKLISKSRRIFIQHKNELIIEPNTAYIIYKGTLLLKSDFYQMQLNSNSILFKSKDISFKATCMSPQSIIISITLDEITQILQDSNQILNSITSKLENLHNGRKQLLEKGNPNIENYNLMEPIFCTEILNFKAFQKIYACENSQIPKKGVKNKFNKPRNFSTSSKRFRIGQQLSSEVTLPSDISVFLSNYPYVKIVQSQERAHQILKMSVSPKYLDKKQKLNTKISQEQKRKVQKQIKKLYYNDKVMRLKIKNIAEKQIPNGKKKNFDSKKAEKQISDYLLFKKIIEYPTNGQSQCATKQAMQHKLISKFTKMTSGSKQQRKTIVLSDPSQNLTESMYLTESMQISDQIKGRESLLKNQQLFQQNHSNNIKSKIDPVVVEQTVLKNQNENYSFYCNKVLYPHLKAHRNTKYKTPRASSSRGDQQNSTSKEFQIQENHLKTSENQKQIKSNNLLDKLKNVYITNCRINTIL